MKPIKIKVDRYSDLDTYDSEGMRCEIRVYRAGKLYWDKVITDERLVGGTVDFMVALFNACGITPEVVY